MSYADRQELRRQIRERALAGAERNAAVACLTVRCRNAGGDRGGHAMCRGESPGNSGCLCTCHDNPGVTVETVP